VLESQVLFDQLVSKFKILLVSVWINHFLVYYLFTQFCFSCCRAYYAFVSFVDSEIVIRPSIVKPR